MDRDTEYETLTPHWHQGTGLPDRKQINKETAAFNDVLDWMVLTDTLRACHPKTTEHTFFASAQGTHSKIYHMLWHKTNLTDFKKTEIIPGAFSDLSGMKLDIGYKRKTGKHTNI